MIITIIISSRSNRVTEILYYRFDLLLELDFYGSLTVVRVDCLSTEKIQINEQRISKFFSG